MSERRRGAERKGRRSEAIAAWYLRLHGWRVLDRRVRCARGEVDLIVRRWRTVAFVEVKWRRDMADLGQAIDAFRLRRVVGAAEALAPRYLRQGDTVRVDVLLLAPGRWPRHIVNASMA
ncbi:YraN family protein [Novosphingobium colocasiae]|uniref:UPF0102 protein GCM10011614_10620 n=1 Tax=Novosphingobium colocasiae TaxID=1256513 RepID=A0A918UEU4_9SPHN|nr:YraN family protein [Novosphingobium colocasiae]GGY97479.1 UPF0102 protein [Novosphingobium colocasiae]